MYYTIILFELIVVSKIIFGIEQHCRTYDEIKDKTGIYRCYDGGCVYIHSDNSSCTCSFSEGVMTGKHCGLYVDMCHPNPCGENGKCLSGIGHHTCDCFDNFHGINCTLTTDNPPEIIKSPSIYYRIKSKQNEYLKLLIVSNTFGKNDYTINIKTKSQQFRKKLNDIKKTTQVKNLVQLCQETLNSDMFTVTECQKEDVKKGECENICDRLPILYAKYYEVETAIVPYFITKIYSKSNMVYFEPVEKKNRMGIKHNLDLQIYVNKDKIEYQYTVRQFIIDDKLSACLPLLSILHQENIKSIYRNEYNEVITIINDITIDDQKICPKNVISVNYKLKFFEQKYSQKSFKELEILDGLNNYNIGEIQESNGIISVRPYKLRAGKYILYFQHIIIDLVKKITEKNTYFYDIEIILVGLNAIIKGSSAPISVMNNQLLTLDATESINPNEDEFYKQTLLEFTWECNIVNDNNCKKYITKEPNRTLDNYLLYKDTAYNFTLTVDVMDHYKTDVGTPSKGYAYIIVYDGSIQFVIEHSIKCIRNCKVLSNPEHEICFKAENNLNNPQFIWSFRSEYDSYNSRVDQIKQKDVPIQLLVVKKNQLISETTYTFFVEYLELRLNSQINITTITTPNIKECKINPDSGIAGDTLFTIFCTDLQNEKNIFEYYQTNKNDNTNIGVLLDCRNGPLIEFKLTSSNSLIVKVINDYGGYDQFPINAIIKECNTTLLKQLFNQIKVKLKMKETSKSVVLISIVSDILHDNNIDEFNLLFKLLDQFILILHKVINDYNIFTNGKMEITELLIISKQLHRVSISLFEYIKTTSDDDILKESDKIEGIKRILQNNIIIFTNNIIFPMEDQCTNYYMTSKFDHLIDITQNLDLILKVFGKIESLDILTYERPITCDDKQINFKSCIVLSVWLKKRSPPTESTQMIYDTIGEPLANELLSKGDKWAITIFNINNKLTQIHNVSCGKGTQFPIMSLDIVNVDESHIKNLIIHNKFDNYIDLMFDIPNTIKEKYKIYTIHVPENNSSKYEFDKSIIVYRIDMKIVGNLFVTLTNATYNLRFAWLRGTRPDIDIMTNEHYATTLLNAGRKYNFMLKSSKEHKDQMHYIGVYDEYKLTQYNKFNVNFSISINSIQCVYWTGSKWTADNIIVGPNTTDTNLHCQSKHTTLFSGSLLAVPEVINPFQVILYTEEITNNRFCLELVVFIFVIYIILFAWSKYNDIKNELKGTILILRDNYPREDEVYLVVVYTGYSAEAGTTSNVCIQLHGDINTSRVHWLHNPGSKTLERFNDDWFLIFTTQSLGELKYIHVWHDSYGDSSKWYCKRIKVICLRDNKSWNFEAERWFSILPEAENIEHTLFVGEPRDWQIDAKEEVELTLRDEYLLASIFISHPRSLITRCQRLSKALCTLFCVMLLSVFFYEIEEADEEEFLKFDVTLTQISISIQSGLLEIIMTSTIFYCFHKSAQFEHYTINMEDMELNRNLDEYKKVWWKRWLLTFCESTPAELEKNSKNIGHNYWLIAGWTLCILIYCLSSCYIIIHGIKFGEIKSMHWLMTLIISMTQTAFLFEPIKIIIYSFVMRKFHKGHNIVNNYNIILGQFRHNTKYSLRNLKVIHGIRESRKRLTYHPITKQDSMIIQNIEQERIRYKSIKENATIFIILIFTSLLCIYSMYLLVSPMRVIHANNINNIFFKTFLQKNTMDLDMLKKFIKEPLIDHLNVKDFYNGMPLNFSVESSNNARGWHNLYSSKMINGGIRLIQKRIKIDGIDWTSDTGIYNEGWVNTNNFDDISAWIYRSIPTTKYFGVWFPYTDNSGFILDLTGEISLYKKDLASHLDNGWLDKGTRSLTIEFKTYTPNTDCVTQFKIEFQTTLGLSYAVKSEVLTIPSESVFITWAVYVSTFVLICLYAGTIMWLIVSFSTMVYDHHSRDGGTWIEYFWSAYECLLLIIMVFTMIAVADRWKMMARASDLYGAERELGYVPMLTDLCRIHDYVVGLAAVAVAMTLFRIYQTTKFLRNILHLQRMLRESGVVIIMIFLASIAMAYDSYSMSFTKVNASFLYALLFAASVSGLTKCYYITDDHFQPHSEYKLV